MPQPVTSADGGANGPPGPPGGMAHVPKAGPVLPWMRVPITIEAGSGVPIGDVLGLDPRLATELSQGSGFRELFPVQAAVWQHCGGGRSSAHDLCVAAPTGSGKTLAYALPVINALCSATARRGGCGAGRLQALVVLPTRDLAAQVYDVFRPLCDAVQLRVALAAARSSEAAEAAQLVGAPLAPGAAAAAAATAAAAAGGGASGGGNGGSSSCSSGSGKGGADVVVATPGRLMAHLSGTPGFTLRHLRFLVVDETDRLLRQSYQEWLPRVLAQLPSAPSQQQQQQQPPRGVGPMGHYADHGDGDGDNQVHFAARWPAASVGTALPFAVPRVVKIIVSATLTRDPAKLQRLALHQPRYVATVAASPASLAAVASLEPTATGGAAAEAATKPATAAAAAAAAARYSLPRSLSEFRLLCSAARKPLVLLALLSEAAAEAQSCIVFTSSLDMTHKLYLMLRAVPELSATVVEYSSHVAVRERTAGLERFKQGGARVLVASDAMTRGMDLDCVQLVINYDAPVYAKTYVHRAGRTARAGKPGRVITLLRDEDMRHFKAMIRKADNNYVRELKLVPERVESFRPALSGALQQLEALLAAERSADVQLQQQQQQLANGAQKGTQQQKEKKGKEGRQEAQKLEKGKVEKEEGQRRQKQEVVGREEEQKKKRRRAEQRDMEEEEEQRQKSAAGDESADQAQAKGEAGGGDTEARGQREGDGGLSERADAGGDSSKQRHKGEKQPEGNEEKGQQQKLGGQHQQGKGRAVEEGEEGRREAGEASGRKRKKSSGGD
ncbi:hypothetical protein Agub_g2179 [Astrephomene gubernaculifera]|uniref:ATP-dependent RNA helicase n=1 Tax=Astrephomene gubernaculifera TaxID=47775 RepID=A0AAD3DH72_9CHLO|nr:hypothetical protein Agub_g2179 [Astrephomene gubernaculifera]